MFAVAIDGPSGAGKSSVSKAVAESLGLIYVDTGALYRTLGLYFIRNGISPDDEAQIKKCLPDISVELIYNEGSQRMLLNGEDVTDKIRSQEVSNAASVSSALKSVREFLFSMQTAMAEKYNVVMDGRDIGSAVLPNADVKIFLTASVEARADRRMKQLRESGVDTPYDVVLKDIEERDYRDSHREINPLGPCADSIIVDSSNITKQETVLKIEQIIKQKM